MATVYNKHDLPLAVKFINDEGKIDIFVCDMVQFDPKLTYKCSVIIDGEIVKRIPRHKLIAIESNN